MRQYPCSVCLPTLSLRVGASNARTLHVHVKNNNIKENKNVVPLCISALKKKSEDVGSSNGIGREMSLLVLVSSATTTELVLSLAIVEGGSNSSMLHCCATS